VFSINGSASLENHNPAILFHNFPANAFPNTACVNRSHRRLATTTLIRNRTPKSALTRWMNS
jgi:hypothetical protein